MTVLMTVNQREPLPGAQCLVEWQGLRPGDEVAAHLVTASGQHLRFPDDEVPGLRRQPWADNTWLLDAGALPTGWQRLDLVVTAPTAHPLSLSLVVRTGPGAGAEEAFQHPGLDTVGGTATVALSLAPTDTGYAVLPQQVPYVPTRDPWLRGGGPAPRHVEVPQALREATALAGHAGLVASGVPVTAVLDLSASMRPRLVAGTVASVLGAVQALAAAADQPAVTVVAVSDRPQPPRQLGLADDPEEFLRVWTAEIGLRTGSRAVTTAGDGRPGVVVTVTDQEGGLAASGYRVVLAAPEPGRTVAASGLGSVVVPEPRPDAAAVVRALAHASPAS
ncbi:hypothetical protein ACI798_02295 [Geodermatophilus sp. SYSU D01045]